MLYITLTNYFEKIGDIVWKQGMVAFAEVFKVLMYQVISF